MYLSETVKPACAGRQPVKLKPKLKPEPET